MRETLKTLGLDTTNGHDLDLDPMIMILTVGSNDVHSYFHMVIEFLID